MRSACERTLRVASGFALVIVLLLAFAPDGVTQPPVRRLPRAPGVPPFFGIPVTPNMIGGGQSGGQIGGGIGGAGIGGIGGGGFGGVVGIGGSGIGGLQGGGLGFG